MGFKSLIKLFSGRFAGRGRGFPASLRSLPGVGINGGVALCVLVSAIDVQEGLLVLVVQHLGLERPGLARLEIVLIGPTPTPTTAMASAQLKMVVFPLLLVSIIGQSLASRSLMSMAFFGPPRASWLNARSQFGAMAVFRSAMAFNLRCG